MFKKTGFAAWGFLFLLFLPALMFGKKSNADLAASLIPDSLRAHAHAVIRYDSTEVDIRGLNKVRYKRTYAITILDEAGKQFGDFFEEYGLFTQINRIDGIFYDANGDEIRRLKNKDIFDRSTLGTDYIFNSDTRIKSYQFAYPHFPYTVVYELEETIKTTFFLPAWEPQPDASCSVEKAAFSLSFPEDLPVRSKAYQMPSSLQQSESHKDGIVTQNWQVNGVAAFEEQPLARTGNFSRPALLLAPSRFRLMNYEGKMDSWHDLGLFNYVLNKGRDSLHEMARKRVHALIAKDTSTIQKIQTLYRYMQKNTRYVADEYGISGWQTFAAGDVCTKGYGDCKGLTNYLKALLKEAGITAYAVLVNAGTDHFYEIDTSFPANTFNHAILCIPERNDTIWVECTSQQLPAGYLGGFTANRDVLVCTENGGYIARTPAYGKDKTFLIRKAKLIYNDEPEMQHVSLHNYYSGIFQDDLLAELKMQTEDKIQRMVNAKFSFPSYHVDHFDYRFTGTQMLPAIEENVEVRAAGLVSKTDKRIFINMGWMNNPMKKIMQVAPRTKPLVLRKSFCVTDTVSLIFPEGMEIESLPSGKNLEYPFASFNCIFHQEGNHILLVRKYEQRTGIFGSASFADYQKLYHLINAEKTGLNIVLLAKKQAQVPMVSK